MKRTLTALACLPLLATLAAVTLTQPTAGAHHTCHPNYDPCLIDYGPGDAGDYDCSDEANGPYYADRVTIIGGADPYELDDDNDGEGCDNDPPQVAQVPQTTTTTVAPEPSATADPTPTPAPETPTPESAPAAAAPGFTG